MPSLSIPCARLVGTVGPVEVKTPYATRKNDYQDVLLVQKLINKVVHDNYVANSVLGGDDNGKLTSPLPENGLPSPQLWSAIKQIELLYFHGRANPHGIAVIDPQADESLFTFLVALANGGQKAKEQLSVQMKVLADAMVPGGKVKVDAGGVGPNGVVPPKITAIEKWLPILLDGLKKFNLIDTDMVLVALACARTETGRFIPISEGMNYYNTTGTFSDAATGQPTYTSTVDNVHNTKQNPHGYDTLKEHAGLVHAHKETWAQNKDGDKGDVYDGRNGNILKGDGWTYRGRGLIQLTGRQWYADVGKAAGVGDLFVQNPDLVNSEQWAGIAVAGYLLHEEKKIRPHLNRGDITGVRKIVNGGGNGLTQFELSWKAGARVIAEQVIQEAKVQVRRRRRRTK